MTNLDTTPLNYSLLKMIKDSIRVFIISLPDTSAYKGIIRTVHLYDTALVFNIHNMNTIDKEKLKLCILREYSDVIDKITITDNNVEFFNPKSYQNVTIFLKSEKQIIALQRKLKIEHLFIENKKTTGK